EAYDPGTDRWSTLDPMPTPRHGTMAAVIGGAIHVPAGADHQGFGASAVHDLFVPPPGSPLVLIRARRTGARVRLRGLVDGVAPAADALPVAVRITDDAGATLAALDGIVARGLRLRYRAPRGTGGVTRLRIRPRRRGGVALRLRALLDGQPPPAL